MQVNRLVLGIAAPYSLTYLLHPLATLVTITLAVIMADSLPSWVLLSYFHSTYPPFLPSCNNVFHPISPFQPPFTP